MSDNLTIPAAIWACKVDGVPLVAGIVEGVLVHPDSPSFGPRGALPEFDEPEMRPPADLVALRDARCECVNGRIVFDTDGDQGPCHRCDVGRPLVDVRVECVCGGKGWETCAEGAERCERCRELGYRIVKGLVDVVQIDDVYAGFDPSRATALLKLEGGRSRVFTILAPAHAEALGSIQPGQWAWTFTEVEA